MGILDVPRAIVEGFPGFTKPASVSQAKEARKRSPLYQVRNAQTDQGVVEAAKRLFALSVSAREPLGQRWTEQYDWARGNTWPQNRPKWRSRANANYIFVNIFSKTALITDSRPIVKALARRSNDRVLVDQYINPMLRWMWEVNDMDELFTEAIAGSLIFGTYFLKTYWDPSAFGGEGMAMTDGVDPSFIWPDPGGTRVGNVEYIYHAQPMALEAIERLWGSEANRVEPEDVALDYYSARERSSLFAAEKGRIDRKPTIGRVIASIMGPKKEAMEPGADIDRALVVELFLKQNNVRRIEVGDDIIEIHYPKGRHIVFANNVLLADQEHDQDIFPFIRFRDYMWPGEFWGGGEVEQLKDIQREMNIHRARLADHFNYFANGQIVMDKGAVEERLITNRPAVVIQKKRGHEYKREQGVPVSQGSYEYVASMQHDFDSVSGTQEISRGREPVQIRSGKAIEMVQKAAENRTRLTEREAKSSLENWAHQSVSQVAENMKKSRVIRVTGDHGQDPEFRRITPPMMQRKLDYEASIGSQLTKGKNRIDVREALMMFEAGLIDDQAVLEGVDFPEHRAVMERVREIRRKQQLMGPAPGGTPPELGLVQGGTGA